MLGIHEAHEASVSSVFQKKKKLMLVLAGSMLAHVEFLSQRCFIIIG